MNRLERGFPFLFLLVVGLALSEAVAGEGTNRVTIKWPSPEFRDLQSAIDAAPPDGATIKIAKGTFDITEPLTIAGKRIKIKGAGSGKERDGKEKSLTHLRGPRPSGVVDSRLAVSMFNYVGGGGTLQDLKLSGFDVVITSRDDDGGRAEPLEVRNTVITASGRGIIWRAQAEVDLFKVEISNMLGIGFMLLNGKLSFANVVITDIEDIGIYIHPPPGTCAPADNTIKNTQLVFCKGPGILVYQTCALIDQSQVGFCGGGGIWAVQAHVEVLNCNLELNLVVGIGAVEAFIVIYNNSIHLTLPHPDTGKFGDGVCLVADVAPTIAFVFDNNIQESARAGVSSMGSEANLGGNTINLSSFDLVGENWKGHSFNFIDLGNNTCDAMGCQAASPGIEPPEPVIPNE